MGATVTSPHRLSYSGLLIVRAAILCCALAVVASAAIGQPASQPAGKHSAARAQQGIPQQDQSAPRLDTSSLEKTIRDAIHEAGEKPDPHADEKLQGDRKLVEYTRQLAVDTHRLAEFTLWLFVVTGGMAAIVFGQLCMFWRQLGHMKEDSKSTKAAAEAAKASADASLLSLRPWLSCDVELGEPLTFNAEGDAVFAFHFIVKNVGHSPAMAVHFLPRISLLEFHDKSMAHLKTMADWNRDMGVNAHTILVPSGISMGREEIGPIIFPGASKTFSYRIPLKRADLEKSCETIKPNTNFSPEVFAIVFYTYPSATVRASTAVSRMILKIGGAFELDKSVGLNEMRLEDFAPGDFST